MQNIVLSKGAILGVIVVIFTFLLYFINPELLSKWWITSIPLLIYIYFMVDAVRAFKAQNEGYATFGQALLSSWLTAIVGGTIGMIFTYLLYNFIDPSLIEMMQQKSIEMVEGFAGNMSEEDYDKMIENMESQNQFGLSGQIIGWLTASFVGLIISLIIAAITKNENNEFA